jgi:hypothetical protein
MAKTYHARAQQWNCACEAGAARPLPDRPAALSRDLNSGGMVMMMVVVVVMMMVLLPVSERRTCERHQQQSCRK